MIDKALRFVTSENLSPLEMFRLFKWRKDLTLRHTFKDLSSASGF